MLSLQIVLSAIALFILAAPSRGDSLAKSNHVHARLLVRSNSFRDISAENASTDHLTTAQIVPLEYMSQTSQKTKRGPRILEYKLNVPKTQKLAKRVQPNSPPLFAFPDCLMCKGGRKDDMGLSVANNFQADQMIKQMIPGAFMGQCLFYGQRPQFVTYLPAIYSLSKPTTDYACARSGLRTIWQLWPSEDYSCEAEYNYYCLNPWTGPDCCWLNPLIEGDAIDTKDKRIDAAMLYFQQMSKAMAMTCTGEVFVMIDNPADIVKQMGVKPSIWLTHELPVLQDLFRERKVTKLTAISFQTYDTTDVTDVLRTRTARDFEWDEELAQAIKAKKLELLRSTNGTMENPDSLRQRASCGSAAVREPPGVDIFG